MSEHAPEMPAGYRQIQPDDLTASLRPYQRLAWLWVYFDDRKGRRWTTTGTGVFIDDDVILTCAHVFALNATIDQVVYVSALPACNSLMTSPDEPPGGLYADTVFACEGAFPPHRRLDEFDPAWDLALVCLSGPAALRSAPPFTPYPYRELASDPQFKGPGSQLRTIGYGGPDGVMIETNLPLLGAVADRHWLQVDRKMTPGQSGAPIFYEDEDQFGRTEFRLVGVVSCDDRKAPQQSIGAMITDTTEAWVNRALIAWRDRKRARSTSVRTLG